MPKSTLYQRISHGIMWGLWVSAIGMGLTPGRVRAEEQNNLLMIPNFWSPPDRMTEMLNLVGQVNTWDDLNNRLEEWGATLSSEELFKLSDDIYKKPAHPSHRQLAYKIVSLFNDLYINWDEPISQLNIPLHGKSYKYALGNGKIDEIFTSEIYAIAHHIGSQYYEGIKAEGFGYYASMHVDVRGYLMNGDQSPIDILLIFFKNHALYLYEKKKYESGKNFSLRIMSNCLETNNELSIALSQFLFEQPIKHYVTPELQKGQKFIFEMINQAVEEYAQNDKKFDLPLPYVEKVVSSWKEYAGLGIVGSFALYRVKKGWDVIKNSFETKKLSKPSDREQLSSPTTSSKSIPEMVLQESKINKKHKKKHAKKVENEEQESDSGSVSAPYREPTLLISYPMLAQNQPIDSDKEKLIQLLEIKHEFLTRCHLIHAIYEKNPESVKPYVNKRELTIMRGGLIHLEMSYTEIVDEKILFFTRMLNRLKKIDLEGPPPEKPISFHSQNPIYKAFELGRNDLGVTPDYDLVMGMIRWRFDILKDKNISAHAHEMLRVEIGELYVQLRNANVHHAKLFHDPSFLPAVNYRNSFAHPSVKMTSMKLI